MPLSAFQRMNDEREQQGLPKFANPRNATAGTVRVLEPNITAQRRLDFFSYALFAEWPHHLRAPLGDAEGAADRGLQGESQSPAGAQPRRGLGVHQRVGSEARQPALRDRRHRRQGRSHCAAGRAGLHRQSAALGHRLQVRRALRRDPDRGHPGAGGPHRKADAGGGAEAGRDRRHHGKPRHAAQHGRDRASGRAHRRLGVGGARRRRDPQGREGAGGQAARHTHVSHAGALSGLRRTRGPRRGRSRSSLRERELSGQAAREHSPLRLARRDEHRRHGRRAGEPVGRRPGW